MTRRGWLERGLELAILATVVAGVVGTARQRAEARAVARGDAERATATAQVPSAVRYGPLGSRLQDWVPARPRSAPGRLGLWLWSAPVTAVGLLLAVASGRLPRWDAEHGCFVAAGTRGPSAVALRMVGADANTVGLVVLSRAPAPSAALLAHEAVHARQAERLGPLVLPVYVWFGARYGYRDHPLERAARAGARAHLAGQRS